jgi:ketosteroid isomerase-like protein
MRAIQSPMELRLWLLATILLATWPAAVSVAQQKSEAASNVLALEAKWNEAYKRNDLATMSSLLAEDFIITVEDGNTFSKSGYIANAAGGTAMHVEISEMSNLKVNVHEKVVVVTGAYYEKGMTKGKPYEYHDRLTDVWMNIDGRWQVIASHYSIPVK